ncbi:MAG: DUF924 domain-containing protein [Alphaproteobacteria bacterium]|nr:DUF924 domain-containing protein [Alphaproteobacteria bacterium]
MPNAADVLISWFGTADLRALPDEEHRRRWYAGGDALDAEIRQRFGALLDDPEALAGWEGEDGRLAAIVVLDQFSRNAFRGTARAFATDGLALALARELVARGGERGFGVHQRGFAYLPFMHAEELAAQDQALALYERLAADHPSAAANLDYAKRHRDIVVRFGRFPGRNPALGRPDTAEELAWLEAGGDTFGARPQTRA